MNKLANIIRPADHEDHPTALARARSAGLEVAGEAEDKVLSIYLKRLRARVNENRDLRGTLAGDLDDARPHVLEMCADVPVAGTEDVFARAVEILLEETAVQARSGASAWLVDEGSGRAIAPVSRDTVFQPPDVVDETGERRRAMPIVHPSITSSLGLQRHEAARGLELRKKIGNPAFFAHLDRPDDMAETAARRLEMGGALPADPTEELPESETVVFGKEGPESIFQSPNPGFNRYTAFSASLARQVLAMCGSGGRFRMGSVMRAANSRGSWYSVRVEFRRAEAP